MSSQTGRAGDYASSLALEDAHQRIRFTREEMPRLLGMFGFIAALHVIGWGLFTHYNSISWSRMSASTRANSLRTVDSSGGAPTPSRARS